MWVSTKKASAFALAAIATLWSSAPRAEVKLAEAGGWIVTTDGRVNAFVSHVWGDNRPEGLNSLNWVGFNESTSSSQADAAGQLRKTKIRSGYVPSTLAFNFRKEVSENLKLASRVEVGMQITNIDPSAVADPTWMDPRSVYLDVSGKWGGVRGGRDLSLFPRQNLLMNYEIGHAYGLGFPCAYDKMFGGSCGHVGFGTLWPDFRAQLTYTTPTIAKIFSVSVGVFDPRSIPTYEWFQTPLPRFEAEAVANYSWREGWGFKLWANGFQQSIGTTESVDPDNDPMTNNSARRNFRQSAYGIGGGLQANLGPVKAGLSGYNGQGMDGFTTFTFNPIYISLGSEVNGREVKNYERKFRPTRGFLAQASVKFGNTWVMGGFGQARFDRMALDAPVSTVDAAPLLRTQTGISTGVFHRIDQIVLALDYFNAHYAFDPRNIADASSATGSRYVDVQQTVHIVNGGVTLEW
ncbi:MAG: hypothetical protein K0R38_1452 [Polyangiaceae bacterium]|nr:hypothetical protein [Polyangiaceae bacterium]